MNDLTMKIWTELSAELKQFILRKVKDESIANDIHQDVFLKIMENQDKISQARSIQEYLYSIARNTTIDHFRRANKKNDLEKVNDYLTGEENISLNSMIAECCIKPFINLLPEKYKQALIKTEFENISQKDLAKHLDISYSGAKSRVQRGKEKLKELILTCCNFSIDKYGNLRPVEKQNCQC